MIRVSVSTANGRKMTFECANKREASKIKTPWQIACNIISEANTRFENDRDRYDYYCRVQTAIQMCSAESTAILLRKAKYFGNPNA